MQRRCWIFGFTPIYFYLLIFRILRRGHNPLESWTAVCTRRAWKGRRLKVHTVFSWTAREIGFVCCVICAASGLRNLHKERRVFLNFRQWTSDPTLWNWDIVALSHSFVERHGRRSLGRETGSLLWRTLPTTAKWFKRSCIGLLAFSALWVERREIVGGWE